MPSSFPVRSVRLSGTARAFFVSEGSSAASVPPSAQTYSNLAAHAAQLGGTEAAAW